MSVEKILEDLLIQPSTSLNPNSSAVSFLQLLFRKMVSSSSPKGKDVPFEVVTIGNVRHEVPKEALEQFYAFLSSKSKSKPSTSSEVRDIVVFDPKVKLFKEYCAGIGSISEKETICMPEWVRKVRSAETTPDVHFADNIIEETLEKLEEMAKIGKPLRENVSTETTVDVGSADDFDEALDKLDEVSNISKNLKENVSKDSDECEIVQVSSSVPKKKRAKVLPKRKQPLRGDKRKIDITEEEEKGISKSSAKRLKKGKFVSKDILMEVECSEKFLMEEGLQEVLDCLRFQSWDKFCEKQEFVCPKVVQDFYIDLHLIPGEIPALELKFRGKKIRVSSMDLAVILKLDHHGYDQFVKGGSWPEDAEDKKSLIKRLCKLDKIPKGPVSTIHMEPKVKILHKLLVCNFFQRGAKPSYVQDEDLLLLDKLLKRERINLPKLIVHQIHHIKDHSQIGYSRVIKKILQTHKLYEAISGSESPVVRDFDPDLFRKMKLVKDPELGWIRTSVTDKQENEDDEEEFDYGPELGESSNFAARLLKIEKQVAELKAGLETLKAEVKDVKGDIKDLLSLYTD